MKKAVIFDLDGTLLDSIRDLAGAINEILKRHGYETLPVETVKSYVGNGLSMLLKRALADRRQQGENVKEEVFRDYLQELILYYHDHCMDLTVPYPGIMEMLKELKNMGIQTAIVTNKNTLAATELWQQLFKDTVSLVVGEDEAHGIRKKPEPDMVMEALQRLNVTPEEAVYVGDSEVDVQTAKNANMDGIFVLWGFRTKEELEGAGAETVIKEPRELGQFLN
ncbi:MAG: HAD-IIIA family hydrolase [Lachnospiraceae bacterium]|jgi:phosphoglycolate phosphatase|nr:HAD-IIIA family hydrolase [Lachnospiraceae bacterium]